MRKAAGIFAVLAVAILLTSDAWALSSKAPEKKTDLKGESARAADEQPEARVAPEGEAKKPFTREAKTSAPHVPAGKTAKPPAKQTVRPESRGKAKPAAVAAPQRAANKAHAPAAGQARKAAAGQNRGQAAARERGAGLMSRIGKADHSRGMGPQNRAQMGRGAQTANARRGYGRAMAGLQARGQYGQPRARALAPMAAPRRGMMRGGMSMPNMPPAMRRGMAMRNMQQGMNMRNTRQGTGRWNMRPGMGQGMARQRMRGAQPAERGMAVGPQRQGRTGQRNLRRADAAAPAKGKRAMNEADVRQAGRKRPAADAKEDRSFRRQDKGKSRPEAGKSGKDKAEKDQR